MKNSNKYYYRYPDRKMDYLLGLRLIMDSLKRLFPTRKHYGENNSRKHVVNECSEEFFVELREKYIDKIRDLIGYKYNEEGPEDIDLEKALLN